MYYILMVTDISLMVTGISYQLKLEITKKYPMKIINEAISNRSLFYKRDILPLVLSLSIIDLLLKDLIFRVLLSIPLLIFGP